jgi:hypothetical protein
MYLLDKWKKMSKSGKSKCYFRRQMSSNLKIKYKIEKIFEISPNSNLNENNWELFYV